MPSAGASLVLVPPVVLLLLTYACRPRRDVVAPVRLAVTRAALLTGGLAVLTVEGLGALDALTTPAVARVWLVLLAGAVALAGWRRRRHPWSPPARLSAAAGRFRRTA
ncbi:MAG TPA: hypothetical protein VGD43_20240, partial [Micromonospora sp.]